MNELTDGPLTLSPAQVRSYAAGPIKSGLWLVAIGVLSVAWAHLFAPSQEGRDIARILGYATAVLGVLSYGFGHLLLAIGRSQHRKRQAASTVDVGDEA